jgi:hypothetical protein
MEGLSPSFCRLGCFSSLWLNQYTGVLAIPCSSIVPVLVCLSSFSVGDCSRELEEVLCSCSKVLVCLAAPPCAYVVLSDLVSVHRGLVLGLPVARCSSSRAGAVDVSFGSGSGSSISVNLPSCRPRRGRRNWFSGTEPCVR